MTVRPTETYVPGLLRVAELDGEAAALVRGAVTGGRLSEAALRDLVGRYALRGADLTLFVVRDVLERPLAEACRAAGVDERTGKRRLAGARARVGLAEDAEHALVGQWLVAERWASPTHVQQLRLFPTKGGADDGQGPAQAEDEGEARVALQEGQSRP